MHLPRFRDVHNQALAEYRHVNRVRSHSHPVPDLVERDGWHEAPFWIWRQGDLHRSRVYARQDAHELLLSDGREVCARLPLTPDKEACCAVEALRELEARGIRLRTRALTTTLFSRLCVSDLFLHGIGGAKYDEMTDRILSRFYGVSAPGFLTVSATLWLLNPYPVSNQDELALRRELRDLEWNPERALRTTNNRDAQSVLVQCDELLRQSPAPITTRASIDSRRQAKLARAAHHARLRAVKRTLASLTADRREHVASRLHNVHLQLQANQLLQSREFSLCLYPAEKLETFLCRSVLQYDARTVTGPAAATPS